MARKSNINDTLLAIHKEITEFEPSGSYFVRIWVGAGLRIAATIIEDFRIEILCNKIAKGE